jgi:xanthine dehydrogenase iron-sulfur cluster and FAD-binding subunit A
VSNLKREKQGPVLPVRSHGLSVFSLNNFVPSCARHISVNACLMPALAADGCHVTTVEGVGTVKGDNLHPVQQAMVDMHGSQCGEYFKGIFVSLWQF